MFGRRREGLMPQAENWNSSDARDAFEEVRLAEKASSWYAIMVCYVDRA